MRPAVLWLGVSLLLVRAQALAGGVHGIRDVRPDRAEAERVVGIHVGLGSGGGDQAILGGRPSGDEHVVGRGRGNRRPRVLTSARIVRIVLVRRGVLVGGVVLVRLVVVRGLPLVGRLIVMTGLVLVRRVILVAWS